MNFAVITPCGNLAVIEATKKPSELEQQALGCSICPNFDTCGTIRDWYAKNERGLSS